MDTTVALFFSLGIAMSSAPVMESNTPNSVHEPSAGTQVVKALTPNKTRSEKHAQVKQRIALTNAWLKEQKQARRQQARKQQQHLDIAYASFICTANWAET